MILDGNPLENIRNTNTVRYVMKNGELFEGDTLDRIWPAETPPAGSTTDLRRRMFSTPRAAYNFGTLP